MQSKIHTKLFLFKDELSLLKWRNRSLKSHDFVTFEDAITIYP